MGTSQIGTPMLMIVGVVLALIVLNIIESPVTESVTVKETYNLPAGSGVTTDNPTITLPSEHWYTTTKSMVVKVGGAVKTGQATLSADQVTITLDSAAVTSTAQAASVTYLTEDTEDDAAMIYQLFPFGLLLVGMMSSFGSAFMNIRGGIRGQGGFGFPIIWSAGIALIGLLLLPVLNNFIDGVEAVYSIAPGFIGVDAIIGLVGLGYAISLGAVVFNSAAPSLTMFRRDRDYPMAG